MLLTNIAIIIPIINIPILPKWSVPIIVIVFSGLITQTIICVIIVEEPINIIGILLGNNMAITIKTNGNAQIAILEYSIYRSVKIGMIMHITVVSSNVMLFTENLLRGKNRIIIPSAIVIILKYKTIGSYSLNI
jgi:hypothetical protein